jgi:hypothetical protein
MDGQRYSIITNIGSNVSRETSVGEKVRGLSFQVPRVTCMLTAIFSFYSTNMTIWS